MKRLDELVPEEEGVISELNGLSFLTRQRLMEIGFVKGTKVKFIRRAPLGDPIEVSLMGFRVMIRCTEAQCIFILSEK